MNEFKYTCPVCGQHIKCDATQSGTVMECPTCLQKIIAPQAPADPNQKFILSGKKLGDGPKTQVSPVPLTPLTPPKPGFPVAALALLVLIVATAAAAIVFRGHIFNSSGGQSPPPKVAGNSETPATAAKPVKPPATPVVIPHANDTNWLLALDAVDFPATPAAGRIHGQDFLAERAYLQNGALTLREGTKGNADFALVINFSGAQAEALAGKTINIATNAPIAARVTLRWKDTDQAVKNNFDTGYALRLEFGPLTKNHLPGRIYFCAPDDARSYVSGAFNAEVRKPKAPKPKPPGT